MALDRNYNQAERQRKEREMSRYVDKASSHEQYVDALRALILNFCTPYAGHNSVLVIPKGVGGLTHYAQIYLYPMRTP